MDNYQSILVIEWRFMCDVGYEVYAKYLTDSRIIQTPTFFISRDVGVFLYTLSLSCLPTLLSLTALTSPNASRIPRYGQNPHLAHKAELYIVQIV